MRIISLLCASLFVLPVSLTQAATSPSEQWQVLSTTDGSSAEARHESGAVVVNRNLYLLGGRGERSVQKYDPSANSWTDLGPMPLELHHFQPVTVGDSIYVIGSFTCCYKLEPSIAEIHVFDTQTNTWSIEGSMPASRVRGSTAAVVRDDIIYILGGNTLGHSGGAVPWFDSYNPATGVWTVLPDAPNARDHFAGVIVNDYLIAAAGRQTAQPNPFVNAVAQTDVYDFRSGAWSTGDDIPTLRAGALAGAAGDEIIVVGGEINTSTIALSTVEAMNIYSREWRTLQPLNTGRHSGGGVVLNGQFHVIAGATNTGGAPETSSHETLVIDEAKAGDLDADGLSNSDELSQYGTDPTVADTDADGLDDGQEVNEFFSDPLVADTDVDELSDGDEVNMWGTNPTMNDTDTDGLDDYAEVITHLTDPLIADTDEDELKDGAEVLQHGTNPKLSDSDADGVDDGEELRLGLDPTNDDTDDDGTKDGEDSDPLGGVGEPQTPSTSGGSSGGNVSLLLLGALLVGRLSRLVIQRVNVSS